MSLFPGTDNTLALMLAITNGRVVGPQSMLEGHCVLIEDKKIKKVASRASLLLQEDTEIIDAGGNFVAPGFIDLHVHGAVGYDTMDASTEALIRIARYHSSGGTTAFTPTTMTDSADRISDALNAINETMHTETQGANIIGAHVEGPYISRERSGAQPAGHARNPIPTEYKQWFAFDGLITQMTLAPELPGVPELLEALLSHEILPSGGHTNATYEELETAISKGLCHATHLFNCMSASQKQGSYRLPGAVEAFLTNQRVMVEIIADGKHVHPGLMKLALKAKGADQICLVTDATAGCGLPDESEFQVGATQAIVKNGVGLTADGSTLAGSVSNMVTMVKNMVQLIGISLVDAVRMASLNPARALGINSHKGSLETQKDADVVIFSPTFEVLKTIVSGKVVFDKVQNI